LRHETVYFFALRPAHPYGTMPAFARPPVILTSARMAAGMTSRARRPATDIPAG
jgi:hypothetical protein